VTAGAQIAAADGAIPGGVPDVLLPYQQAWIADPAAVKVCEKSRRVGLSWGEASDAALTAAQAREAGGQNHWYIGYNKEMAQEFIRDCANWARHFQLAADEVGEELLKDEDRDILTYVIRFASGFRITALSSRPSNLRGKQGVVIIDEAAFHEHLAELIKAAMALLMWGGKVRIISTHNGELNPFNELVLEIRAGKRPYSLHRIEFNEAIKQGLYRRICMVTGQTWTLAAEAAWVAELRSSYGDAAGEELDCIPGSGSGAYLTRALIEAVMDAAIPVIRLTQPDGFTQLPARLREAETRDWCVDHLKPLIEALEPHLYHYFGEDFARTGDVTVIQVFAQQRTLDLTTSFTVELRNVPFEQQRQILFYVVDRLPRFRAGALDARGNGQYLAEVAMQRYGVTRVEPVILTVEWYRENMPRMKAAFEDRTIRIPRDADLLSDLRCLVMEKGVAKVPDTARIRGSDGRYRHGDFAVALALACYAVYVMEPAPIEWTPVPAKSSRWDKSADADDDLVADLPDMQAGAW